MTNLDTPVCPHTRTTSAVGPFGLSVFVGPTLCDINGKVCLLETDMECDTWEELKEEIDA